MRKISLLLFVVIASWIAYQLYQLSANPTEPIITTSADKATAKSLPIKAVKADAPVAPAPAPLVAPVAEPEPVAPPPTPEVNPLAPCPAKIYACFGALANNIIDPTCPVYKPVWAYLSKDEGANWLKVGCYATEIDAEKAIDKAHKGMLLADKQSKEKAKTDLPVVATNAEVKRAHKAAEEHKTKPEEHKSKPENKTASEVTPVSEAEPPMHEHAVPEPEKSASGAQKGYVAQFKGGLGFVSVASRTYPTEEMKKKALDMWDKDMRILEPDGTINEKYMLKKPSAMPMPGHY